jgi:polyvinyl alcohol dehydrogenase (cytochrome)
MRTMRAAAALLAGTAMLGAALAGCGGSGNPAHPAGTRPGRASGPRGSHGASGAPAHTLPAGPSAGQAAHPAAAWPAFGGGPQRTGAAAGLPAAGKLSVAWQRHLDGAVYGQPLVVGGLVIAATENDSVYALDETTGRIAWRTHLASPVPLSSLPCGDIDPLGITGTPVYDRADGLVYAVAETPGYRHVLFGLSVSDGAVRVERDIPAPDHQPRYDQQRAALALEDGRVYVAFGGLFGDCGPYIGSVAGVPASGSGPVISYLVPTAKGGAIWGTAGTVTGPDGTLYVATGNGAATGGTFDGSDSVTALSPGLHRTGIFAPTAWAADNAADLDLGSAQPALLPGGLLLQVGKRGTAYLLRASRLGGVGGQLTQGPVCPAYGAAAVSGSTVYEPCLNGGTAAVSVAGSRIRVLWRGPADANGSPVTGGGAVWVTSWPSGVLYELSPATGAVREKISLGAALPHFSSLSLAGSFAFAGTGDGVTAVRGA